MKFDDIKLNSINIYTKVFKKSFFILSKIYIVLKNI